MAGPRIGDRPHAIGQSELLTLQPIPGHTHAAGGQGCVKGDEVAAGDLLQDISLQTHNAQIVGNRGDRFGIQHHPALLGDVVIHPFGVDDPLALPKHDVTFQVQLTISLRIVGVTGEQIGQRWQPSDDAVGR